MLIGAAISKDPPPLVTLSGALIDRVVPFKLLGVNVASNLKWNTHIEAISQKLHLACIF